MDLPSDRGSLLNEIASIAIGKEQDRANTPISALIHVESGQQ